MPIEILMPALSPTMKEGNLAKWMKQEGDQVNPGDVIAEIETDKATMEVEVVDGGVLGKIIVPDGSENIAVNAVIALLLEDGEDKSVLDSYEVAEVIAEKKKEEVRSESANAAPVTPQSDVRSQAPKLQPIVPVINISNTPKQSHHATPVAKRIAENNSLNLSLIKGSGPNNRITKEDVTDYLSNGATSNVVLRNEVEAVAVKNSNIRKIIAERLLVAKQTIPHFYLTIDCNMDSLLDIREQINNVASKDEHGKALYKISINDFIIKASALALKDVPKANASWTDAEIFIYNNVDISIAVATEDGLITPIVSNADQKPIKNISSEMKILAKKARENKLQPHEFQGGGFSISNLGMYGVKQFSAIVNPPQSCILAVGATEKQVVVTEDDQIATANMTHFTISCDHRVVDGAVGAEFLARFKFYIENPATMII
ncbi:MAG: pyruvate dehydrogenase complex dihydrolipoamide acetyltransferase [Rickettsiales bacterium]|jgi:pyruvate dehydrogenase E2 component (dihydrolipoamide acetyltransferase)|nr:pyruvate dehydrogenase complex dihydrolipoamide acetyltransferase [Rickettsiales bacterium]